ncbi:MAG: NAD-dependent epimerase/dehydratase family protein, partial [Deltaproteobacteria bacterium]|nr:NAD-dependent epimerase/dehydratase family protein [Deltaproteobacteria bacterium]
QAAWKAGVKRLVFLGSSCIYPRDCPQPMREEYLLTGPLEPTNRPYAVAKIAGIIQCEAYNRQYGTRFLAVMPTNLYGPRDNFDLETSHVLPALIRKFHLAKLAAHGDWEGILRDENCFGPIPNDLRANLTAISHYHGHVLPRSLPHNPLIPNPGVTLWGTGTPRRELLHVDDLAGACVFLMCRSDQTFDDLCFGRFMGDSASSAAAHDEGVRLPLINVGCGTDKSIRELADSVSRVVGFEGEIIWDREKPDGTPQKLLDVSRLKSLGWSPKIDFEAGIESTYRWYCKQGG